MRDNCKQKYHAPALQMKVPSQTTKPTMVTRKERENANANVSENESENAGVARP